MNSNTTGTRVSQTLCYLLQLVANPLGGLTRVVRHVILSVPCLQLEDGAEYAGEGDDAWCQVMV